MSKKELLGKVLLRHDAVGDVNDLAAGAAVLERPVDRVREPARGVDVAEEDVSERAAALLAGEVGEHDGLDRVQADPPLHDDGADRADLHGSFAVVGDAEAKVVAALLQEQVGGSRFRLEAGRASRPRRSAGPGLI